METKFVRIDYKNSPATTAVSEEHRKIIEVLTSRNFRPKKFFLTNNHSGLFVRKVFYSAD